MKKPGLRTAAVAVRVTVAADMVKLFERKSIDSLVAEFVGGLFSKTNGNPSDNTLNET